VTGITLLADELDGFGLSQPPLADFDEATAASLK
jgi:hypothetical protein